ncbi:MAG: T9SS type A sorting domain-containing protein, partial [Bacteroidetes bacterium]|nr:T9SS type A sorting domain-containing protein [Bacteroidota bacterium]
MSAKLVVLTVAGLLFVGSPALSLVAFAQDLVFEQVGDVPICAADLDFDSLGALWASSSGFDFWYLDPILQTWDGPGNRGGDAFLALTSDTLIISNGIAVHRSLDGGKEWVVSHLEGGPLFDTATDGPNNGLILVGEETGGTGIAYSTDRGATFTESAFTVSTNRRSTLHSAVEIPDGPATGRLVAGVFNGIVVSDDGGQTWSPSSLFEDFRFSTQRVVIGEDPSSGTRRLYATVVDAQASGPQLYTSDDDGLTWANVPDMVDAELFVFVPGTSGSLLAVEDGTALEGDKLSLHWSEDGGVSWSIVGELPAEVNGGGIHTNDMLIGPDNHLYVAVGRAGPEPEWVYRTTEPVVVANEPEAPPAPAAKRFVVYPNPATDRITVTASEIDGDVVLYDVLGRAVRRARLVAGKAALDTSRLPAGVYVVRVGGESRLVTIR